MTERKPIADARTKSGRSLKLPSAFWAVIGLACLLAMNWFFIPGFFEVRVRDGVFFGSLIDVLNRGSSGMLLAIGMTLVIATGGVDLSVGSVIAICGAVIAVLLTTTGCGVFLAIAAGLLAAIFAGLINGFLIAWLKIEPIIATLVLMVAGRGLAKYISNEQTVSIPDSIAEPWLNYIGKGHLFGLPFPVIVAATAFLITLVVVRKTSIGLLIESVGANPAASRACGINDRTVKLFVYAFAGLCAGLAGLIELANIGISDATNAGSLSELDAIFAVLVGGTALTGGRFSLTGAVVGAILLQCLMTTFYTWGVPSDVAPVPKAIIILLVCLLQSAPVRESIGRQFKKMTTFRGASSL